MYHSNKPGQNKPIIQDALPRRNTTKTIPVITRSFGIWQFPVQLEAFNTRELMKKLALLALIPMIAGCAGLVQTGSISKAYETYERGHYAQTLKLITRAEYISMATPELKAELTYLRAQTYQKLNQNDEANTLFEYLRDQHEDSQYGYLAARRLEER